MSGDTLVDFGVTVGVLNSTELGTVCKEHTIALQVTN